MEKKNEKAQIVDLPTTKETTKQENTKAEKPQSIAEILESQLKAIQHKKRLADNRDIFIIKRKNLAEYKKILKQQAIDNVFASDGFSLNFTNRENYSSKTEFSISNPEMLLKFLVFLEDEMTKAIERIEKELLQDIA